MIKRWVLLIGVGRPGGGLTPLQAVESGLDEMEAWALGQGIPRPNINRFSDAEGQKVALRPLQDLIKRLNNDLEVPDQLIVYFCGHGFHGAGGEFWLLSDAPEVPSEAVNLAATEALARNSAFSHVVLISDACRVPADNVQFISVSGSSLFPNSAPAGPSKAVDQFFASSLGQPALEVNERGGVSSIYTTQVVRSLSGMEAILLEPQDRSAATPVVIRAWPLKRYLPRAVSQRLRDLNVSHAMVPDAIIASDPDMWLAIFPSSPALSAAPAPRPPVSEPVFAEVDEVWQDAPAGENAGSGLLHQRPTPVRSVLPTVPQPARKEFTSPPSASEILQTKLTFALDPVLHAQKEHKRALRRGFEQTAAVNRNPKNSPYQGAAEAGSELPQVNWHFETECGFVIGRGSIVEASSTAGVFVDRPSISEVRVSSSRNTPELVLLKLQGGATLMLPAVVGQIGYLVTDKGGALTSMGYEPSSQTAGWQRFTQTANAVRLLRRVLNDAAVAGTLRLANVEDSKVGDLQRRVQTEGAADLGLLVLAGYASYFCRRIDLLSFVRQVALHRCGFLPMDLAILAALSDPSFALAAQRVLPPFPMLAQGWALMQASGIKLPSSLGELPRQLMPSVWTTFAEDGYRQLEQYLQTSVAEESTSGSAFPE